MCVCVKKKAVFVTEYKFSPGYKTWPVKEAGMRPERPVSATGN